MAEDSTAKKVGTVSIRTRRLLQQGALLLPAIMEALRDEFEVDFRGAGSVSLMLSNPTTPSPVIRVTGTNLNGRMGADVTLPIDLILLNAGQIWGLDMPEAEPQKEESGDDDVPDGYVKV